MALHPQSPDRNTLRRRWERIGVAVSELPPAAEYEDRMAYAEAIQKRILKGFQGEETKEVRRSMRYAAYVLAEVISDGSNVVTPDDITFAIQIGARSPSPEKIHTYRQDVEAWLGRIDLIELDPSFCDLPEYRRFDKIWVAPIAPPLDELLAHLGEPQVMSKRTIERTLRQAFLGDESRDLDFDDRQPETDDRDISQRLMWNVTGGPKPQRQGYREQQSQDGTTVTLRLRCRD